MLSRKQINRVQSTFAHVADDPAALGAAFYDTLFSNAPAARMLFPQDMERQREKLAGMLTVVVASLHDLEGLVPVVRDLGARHVAYGATDAHYDIVGTALIETLSKTVPGWTDEDGAAWAELYEVASGVMKDGAAEALGRAEARAG